MFFALLLTSLRRFFSLAGRSIWLGSSVVEQGPEKPCVGGAIPSPATKLNMGSLIKTNFRLTKNEDLCFFRPVSWFEPLRWEEVFRSKKDPRISRSKVHVDLGAGDGGFIRARARNHPEVNFLAVERLLGRARKIARGAFRDGLDNVRVLRIEAAYAVEHLFSPHSITSISIFFPDPWPKRRHHKNRLIQPSFLECCARTLRLDGWLMMKTDDASYFEHIEEVLGKCKTLQRWDGVHPEILLPEKTDFERDFLKEKRQIYFVAAKPIVSRNAERGICNLRNHCE